MDAFEMGIRCAWCSRVQDGDDWIEAALIRARTPGNPPLWSDGICPSCFDMLVAPSSKRSEGLEPRRGHAVGGVPAEVRARSGEPRGADAAET